MAILCGTGPIVRLWVYWFQTSAGYHSRVRPGFGYGKYSVSFPLERQEYIRFVCLKSFNMNDIVGKQNRLQGKAAEYRVASELLLRGLHTHFPSIEEGYDIMVGGGIRVQVKSTNLRHNSVTPNGAYWFRFRKVSNYRTNSCSIKWKNHPREFSKECDFVVLVGVTQWRFWIIPAAELDNLQCVMLRDPVLNDSQADEVAKLHSEGLNTVEISNKLGVSQFIVSRTLRGQANPNEQFMSQKLMQYENSWNLIVGCLGSLREADAALIQSENYNKEALVNA